MIIAVSGSRSLSPNPRLWDAIIPAGTSQIIHGGARGVDTSIDRWARAHGLPVLIIQPDYQKYGRRAPLQRNDEIIAAADCLIAVWDGHSRGTAYTIRAARRRGIAVKAYRPV